MKVARDALTSDRLYIRRTWLDNYRSSALGVGLGAALFDRLWGRIVDGILARAKVAVICDTETPDAPDALLGFIVWEPGTVVVIHYIYTRFPVRRSGVARRLMEFAGLDSLDVIRASHWTVDAQKVTAPWAKHRMYDIALALSPVGDSAHGSH